MRLVQFGSPTDAWVMDFDHWKGLVADVFTRFDGFFVAHNSRFDVTALGRHDVHVPWHKVHDTMIMMRLAEPMYLAGLKEAASRHVSPSAADSQEILGAAMAKQKWGWDTIPIDFPPYLFYAAMDAVLTSRLFETDIAKEGRRSPVYSLEMETRAVSCHMEQNGLRIDTRFAGEWHDRLAMQADTIRDEVSRKYGISVSSPAEVGRWMMTDGEARKYLTKSTAGGAVSVDKEVLEKIEYHCHGGDAGELATMTLTLRRCEKVRSAYFENFLEGVDRRGVLHPQIETLAARTGRMSIRVPSLQNLPKRSPLDEYKAVRTAVIPYDEDQVVLTCDFNQIELRLISALSEDPGLIEAFRAADASGSDIFTEIARDLYDDPGFVKADPRRAVVKNYMYAQSYGAGPAKMAITAKVPIAKIHEIRAGMAVKYPGLFEYGKQCMRTAVENDYVVHTAYGRRLKIDDRRPYTATNAIIQGTAADVMKKAIVTLAQAGLEDMMVIPVHDEMLFSVKREDAYEVGRVIRECMSCSDFVLPLSTESQVGESWGGVA